MLGGGGVDGGKCLYSVTEISFLLSLFFLYLFFIFENLTFLSAIHRAAGPELLEACQKVPKVWPRVRCPTGEARITP